MSSVNTIQPALLFIPDISGFTKFINKVAIDHSTHIISELLEVIIESNTLGLSISEIEGDAVLFYRIGKEPNLNEITKQVESMFLAFHRHLKLYERDRICQCGACSIANNLNLKFVYHYGEIITRKIQKFEKLFGSDVTLAHRLLKNNIQEDAYLLLSSLPAQVDDMKSWMPLKQGKIRYNDIGEINYTYFNLSALLSKVPELPVKTAAIKYKYPIHTAINITSSLEKVHSIITNVSLKPKWIIGLKYVKEQKNHLSKVGSEHLCVMPTTSMNFEITSQQIKKGEIDYVEKTNSIKWLSPLYVFYKISRISAQKTQIIIAIHYKKNVLTKLYLDFPLRIMIWIMARISLLRLKKFITNI